MDWPTFLPHKRGNKMDVLVKTQATADINLIIPLMINTGAPDTGATLTVKAINPDGTENTSFTAPTISEVIAGSGVYKLIFPAAAANKLFTLADEYNPYTVLVKSATSGSTGYRGVRAYCVSRLPGEVAKSTEVDALPTLTEIEASTVLAKEATIALVKKFIKNKKVLTESGGVYSLVIYDDNDIDEIMRKTIKDIAGADITAIGAGVIAREAKSSV